MTQMEVVRISVGRPQALTHNGQTLDSAISKRRVEGRVYLSKVNFEGDEQADLVHHGGPDKAVCAYPVEHYAYWEETLAVKLPENAFGENLTLRGLTERDVRIGDIYQIGGAVLQVCQPRIPCGKISMRTGVPNFVKLFKDTGYTGYYLRVLEEGDVDANPELVLLERGQGMTIAEVNHVLFHDDANRDAMRRIIGDEAAAGSLREMLAKHLERLEKGEA
ncbi:MOSC domain-containing protein YiiM [Tumebacillus sp. BK434]|uniref:MOSC domain-containing protein n=1 Tax=Tumebacillus sp. BK434 TaxID=2512169 RepID=UPI001052B634|nr:MOSC domain-containing protein [Tumebacillus sp. BK434]TCP58072.1 MOSC domain-containing protein YiiM [Tumebacillus sp. BK434]